MAIVDFEGLEDNALIHASSMCLNRNLLAYSLVLLDVWINYMPYVHT